jgi:hypothetical protein
VTKGDRKFWLPHAQWQSNCFGYFQLQFDTNSLVAIESFQLPSDGPMSMILASYRMATKNFDHQGI